MKTQPRIIQGGKSPQTPFLAAPKLLINPTHTARELLVISASVEVWLAKEGHEGLVGINNDCLFIERIKRRNS